MEKMVYYQHCIRIVSATIIVYQYFIWDLLQDIYGKVHNNIIRCSYNFCILYLR